LKTNEVAEIFNTGKIHDFVEKYLKNNAEGMTTSERRSYYIKMVGWGKEMKYFSSFYRFKKPHGKMRLIILLTGSNGVFWLGAILLNTRRRSVPRQI
jgi:hypothetical protein